MIIHATTFSYSNDIEKLRESFNDDEIEKITLIYLENIFKMGPDYIYTTSMKKVTIDKAEQIYNLFIDRSKLRYMKSFIPS